MKGRRDTPVVRALTADRGDVGLRLDLVLRRHLADVDSATRTRIQAWIERGQVTINGRQTRRVATRAALGDVVGVSLPAAAARSVMSAEPLPLHVLFEDDQLLVLNKPAGIVVHPTYKHVDGTLMNALLWHAREWPSGLRPSLVGRLDKDTSGVVVVAKSAAVHAALQAALAHAGRPGDRFGSEKTYLAVVYGRVRPASGRIELRLARDAGDRRRVLASDLTGAPSLTYFDCLGRTPGPGPGLSLLRCRLATGRTHQIRVHLAARGWPIVGDRIYGQPPKRDVVDAPLAAALRAFSRQALHAWQVQFTHPVARTALRIEAPIPPDLDSLLRAAGWFLGAADRFNR